MGFPWTQLATHVFFSVIASAMMSDLSFFVIQRCFNSLAPVASVPTSSMPSQLALFYSLQSQSSLATNN